MSLLQAGVTIEVGASAATRGAGSIGPQGGVRSGAVARVFPRRTKASPNDAMAFFGPPDLFAEADEVHVDVTFTADKPRAESLAEDWRHVAPVRIGGVAYGDRGQEFVPGKYIKHGYMFTSRGCPRRCWFCSVWKRDPIPRQRQIVPVKTSVKRREVQHDNTLL